MAPMSMPSSRLAGGDQGGQPAGLEVVLDLEPLLAGDGAVVGPDQVGDAAGRWWRSRPSASGVLGGQLVQPGGQPLGQPPGVDEDERGAVGPDQLEQPGIDGRPDRGPDLGIAGGRPRGSARRPTGRPSSPMSSTGTTTCSSSGLRTPGVDDGDGPVASAEPAGQLLERPLGGRQADALRAAAVGQLLQPLETTGPGGRPAWCRRRRGPRRR